MDCSRSPRKVSRCEGLSAPSCWSFGDTTVHADVAESMPVEASSGHRADGVSSNCIAGSERRQSTRNCMYVNDPSPCLSADLHPVQQLFALERATRSSPRKSLAKQSEWNVPEGSVAASRRP